MHSGRRNATIVRVDFGGRIVPILVTHVDREKDHANQVHMVMRLFDALRPPCVLLADLNADGKNPAVHDLLSLADIHDCITESNAKIEARGRLDWILARGFKAIGGGEIQKGASDHPLYWVDLEMSP